MLWPLSCGNGSTVIDSNTAPVIGSCYGIIVPLEDVKNADETDKETANPLIDMDENLDVAMVKIFEMQMTMTTKYDLKRVTLFFSF